MNDSYWEMIAQQPAWKAWSGLAFESVCFKHIDLLKKAMHIPDGTEVFSWRYNATKNITEEAGAQIDLVFDRPDNIVNLCEIKYCNKPFVIDKKYAAYLLNREKIYSKITKTHKQIFHSMVVSGGLQENAYSEDLISSIATLEDLF